MVATFISITFVPFLKIFIQIETAKSVIFFLKYSSSYFNFFVSL